MLDNSVALSWCFEDEQTPGLLSVLDRLTEAGAFAPQLWPLEATNGLLAAFRRGRIDAAKLATLSRFLKRLPISLDDSTAQRSWTDTARLAKDHNLTCYDAAYLELALRLGLPLATQDKALLQAAGDTGVALIR